MSSNYRSKIKDAMLTQNSALPSDSESEKKSASIRLVPKATHELLERFDRFRKEYEKELAKKPKHTLKRQLELSKEDAIVFENLAKVLSTFENGNDLSAYFWKSI